MDNGVALTLPVRVSYDINELIKLIKFHYSNMVSSHFLTRLKAKFASEIVRSDLQIEVWIL